MEILNKNGIKLSRRNTKKGSNVYAQFEWKMSDVVLKSWRDGSINFEQRGVEFPSHWSESAITIVTSKYFRGALNSPEREHSLKQLIDRVIDSYTNEGIKYNYFYSREDSEIFRDEMKFALLSQQFSFNSPVWFNVGTKSKWQVSACYILSVEDKMEDILEWYKEEGLIFKGGSGSGVNLSNLRSSKELLSSGGLASGPVSFMRGADASAGTIKSGGATRRAAKMVILDVDHPDIREFINCKKEEEEKIKVLRDAGYDMDLGGKDMISVQYQNANNSVRVNDEFMTAVVNNSTYNLLSRDKKSIIEKVEALDLFKEMAEAAWACADPGIQYDNVIQKWHTLPKEGRISATNPCSEFVHLDNSSCNLASIKLTSFYNNNSREFDLEGYLYLINLIMLACEISISFGSFPTKKIGEVTKKSRPVGLGYTDLGALLMLLGVPYDSEEGRDIAATLTSLLTARSYLTSAELARSVGSFEYYENNKEEVNNVLVLHKMEGEKLSGKYNRKNYRDKLKNLSELVIMQNELFSNLLKEISVKGLRNSQVTVLAPTGTISFFMDSTTTGVEPEFSLIKLKKIADGSMIKIANKEVESALKNLNYTEGERESIIRNLEESGDIYSSQVLKEEDYQVFSCAVGRNSITPMGHVKMMSAIQPFLSGAISKTVNLPESATVEDIMEIYIEGWRLGLKAIAVYRDNCKVGQPLSTESKEKEEEPITDLFGKPRPLRRRLPMQREAKTTSFNVGGAEGYLTTGEYENGELGEVFLKMSKQGSTLAGVMDAFAIAVSIGLQYGVPLETFIEKFTNSRFEPSGMTNDKDVRMASSVMDYVFRRIALDYMDKEMRDSLNIISTSERVTLLDKRELDDEKVKNLSEKEDSFKGLSNLRISNDSPMCFSCGVHMQRSGACHVCPNCGSTSGCS